MPQEVVAMTIVGTSGTRKFSNAKAARKDTTLRRHYQYGVVHGVIARDLRPHEQRIWQSVNQTQHPQAELRVIPALQVCDLRT